MIEKRILLVDTLPYGTTVAEGNNATPWQSIPLRKINCHLIMISLTFAAWCGHEGVVKVLLMRKEVNPDKADDDGQAPLSDAAAHGCEEVVKNTPHAGRCQPRQTR